VRIPVKSAHIAGEDLRPERGSRAEIDPTGGTNDIFFDIAQRDPPKPFQERRRILKTQGKVRLRIGKIS